MSEARVTESPDIESGDALPVLLAGTAAAAESTTPGSILRRAREARGQSIADVVQVIRFSAHQIAALERDDYASLPGATSLRGMVRNYAKFLKMDAAPLLAQIDPAVPHAEAEVRPPANMGEAGPSTIVERVPPGFVAAGIGVLLMLLAGYGYFSLAGGGALAKLWRGVLGGSEVAVPNPVAAPGAVPVLAPAPAVIAEKEPVNAGASSSPLLAGGLRIEFDERSWIEIRDATQKIVFVGEYPAGTRQNVEGKAPFQIWIGKASGVRVFMGERSIDLKPHIREDIARFSVE